MSSCDKTGKCPVWLCKIVEKVAQSLAPKKEPCMCCELIRHWLFGFILFNFLIGGIGYVLWKLS